jgi:putative CocE/NonD family hydrolase
MHHAAHLAAIPQAGGGVIGQAGRLYDVLSHPSGDEYWNTKGYLRDDDQFATPALHVSSWLDSAPDATLYASELMRRNSTTALARANQFVIMSPTEHCASEGATEHTKVGDLDVGDARETYWLLYLAWFDHWLKGVQNGVERRPKVQYYLSGLNAWRTASTWPIPEMRQVPFYLASRRGARTSSGDGALVSTTPSSIASDAFVYDPANPVPSKGGTICCTGNPKDVPGMFDQRTTESRQDVLVYSTPPLADGVRIAGPVSLHLFVGSDAKDTDFTARLIDVDEQGRAWNVANGILRMRYREDLRRSLFMRGGEIYSVTISLKATAFLFKRGHRIRLHVSSSDFPMYDPNLNTGGDNITETRWVKATNTVYHGGTTPSRLVLPVVP